MQISDAEWVVMNLIWSSSPIEAAEVIDQIAAVNDWSAMTQRAKQRAWAPLREPYPALR